MLYPSKQDEIGNTEVTELYPIYFNRTRWADTSSDRNHQCLSDMEISF